jgi:predicted DNA-binding transcriptional regulator YafY
VLDDCTQAKAKARAEPKLRPGMSKELDTLAVAIDYTNWRGERSVRRIRPVEIFWGQNDWHPEPQWLMAATDLEKGEPRTFAMRDIHSWQPL